MRSTLIKLFRVHIEGGGGLFSEFIIKVQGCLVVDKNNSTEN